MVRAMDWSRLAARLEQGLGLRSPAVAIAFCDAPPPGIGRVDRAGPSGCSYWKLAAAGSVFYTEASDHLGCPIGAHTHGVPLGPAQTAELGQVLELMAGLDYVRPAEVPSIPTMAEPFRCAVYAPLAATPVAPDVVLLRGTPRQLMVASEAARAAGLEAALPIRERPTCSMIPEVLAATRGQSSYGCIGNRVYTGLADEEAYFARPGSRLEAFADKVAVIAAANRELEAFHRARLDAR
jgi:uncharacterized protein (DUF169 family)